MERMAAFKAGKELFEIRSDTFPDPKDDECLVRIKACGICVWCMSFWMDELLDDHMGAGATGHEAVGVIERPAKGSPFKAGDRVLVYNIRGCGRCRFCKSGHPTYCSNKKTICQGYTTRLAAPDRCLLSLPETFNWAEATLLGDMLGTSMHAVRRASIKEDETATVWGLGPVGSLVARALKAVGVNKVIAIDVINSRLQLAAKLGADVTINPKTDNAVDIIRDQTDGLGADVAFLAVENEKATEDSFSSLRPGSGRLILIADNKIQLANTDRIVLGTFYFNPCEWEENLEFVLDGKISLEGIVSHTYPLKEINEAFRKRAYDKDNSMKVVVTMEDEDA